MSSTYSPPPSDCGSVGLAANSCNCSTRIQHANGECLKITAVRYRDLDTIAPLTPQSSPTRRRPEEAILMDDLRRAKEEMRGLREELQKMRDERDKWKNRNHRIPVECYEIIKQHGLQSDVSLTTLQHFDTPAAVKRLEGHAQHMQKLFARDSYDLAATVQNVIAEIQFVKTNMGSDTLRWRLYSALSLMQHISTGLQKTLSCKIQEAGFESTRSKVFCDDYLRSTLKSADVQLLSTLNEIRERDMDDYYLAFRERFAPAYDVVHHEYALEFYEKTRALMIHMYLQRRALIVPQNTIDEAVLKDQKKEGNGGSPETVWI